MRVYLACFDIENDRHRRKLSNLLLEYGDRVQYSVFEINLPDEKKFHQLREKCSRYVEQGDSLRFYWLNQPARQKSVDVWGERIAYYPQAVVL